MIEVQNNKACFVQLWRKLERTRRLLGGQYKRFCIRNVLKSWFPAEANDNFIWEVCHLCEQEGSIRASIENCSGQSSACSWASAIGKSI